MVLLVVICTYMQHLQAHGVLCAQEVATGQACKTRFPSIDVHHSYGNVACIFFPCNMKMLNVSKLSQTSMHMCICTHEY